MNEKFQVKFLEEASEFIDSLDEKARDKVIYNIQKSKFITDKELFNKLNEEIWEFRTLYNKLYYRLFAFWDRSGQKEIIVITTHGLIKKTNKTPISDIEKAERIRKLYFQRKG